MGEFKDANCQIQDSRERPRVLLIEQDTAIAEKIAAWLDLYDVEVMRACSGMPGFWAAVYGDPDVILCGQWMSEQDTRSLVPEAPHCSRALSIEQATSEDQAASWLSLYEVEVSPPRLGTPGFWAVADADSDVIQFGRWTPEQKELSYIDRLQSHPQTFDIPLIVTTCAEIKESKHRLRSMGIAACLRQPVVMSELLNELRRHIILQPQAVQREKATVAAGISRPLRQREQAQNWEPMLESWEPSVI